MEVGSISGGSYFPAIAWGDAIAKTRSRRIPGVGRVSTDDLLAELSRGTSTQRARIPVDAKPLVDEFFIYNGSLSIPETIIYDGKGNTIFGFQRGKVQRLDQALKELPEGTMLPSLMRITHDNIDKTIETISSLKQPGTRLDPSVFRKQFVKSGLMIDRYL